ncbi:hypothetical protein ADM90_02845 [Lysinibacillus macroides]|uniref:Uncharacterized protein n=1 Tax=Lysinibacillus macroides TaxID=33935 RepID=A0A0M9DN59_9BACI|nr:hypothetical protein ADM90_02845 [Lysinibacillus macroides]
MKEVSVIVIHNEMFKKHYQKLKQLSFITLAKNFQEARMLAVSKPTLSLQKSFLVLYKLN